MLSRHRRKLVHQQSTDDESRDRKLWKFNRITFQSNETTANWVIGVTEVLHDHLQDRTQTILIKTSINHFRNVNTRTKHVGITFRM